MKLEDFFTLTEMKDGLTALARVEELASIMQKEKDSVVKNVVEAARQWSTVASTLAATESKDCLDLFVRLDGLSFLGRWLQQVDKCSDDISDSFAEESITALLAALEKLPIDKDRLISSGINATVKDLFGHKSTMVQEGARTLFDGWNQVRDEDADHQDIEKGGACLEVEAADHQESGCPEQSDASVFPSMGGADKHLVEPSVDELQPPESPDGSHSCSVEDVKFDMSTNQQTFVIPSNRADEDGSQGYPLQSQSILEETLSHPAGSAASTGTCSSSVLPKVNAEGKSLDIPQLKEAPEDAKETDGVKGIQDKSGREETSAVSTLLAPKSSSSTINDLQSVMETAAKETLVSEVKGVSGDDELLKPSSSTVEIKTTGQGAECLPNDSQDLTSDGHNLRREKSLETSFCRIEDVGAGSNIKDIAGESSSKVGRREELAIPAEVPKLKMDVKASDKMEKRKLEMELEYGVDDALEVARQVAKEVEREVVDNREPFCSSSSEKNSDGGIVQQGSPDSINDDKDQLMTDPPDDMPAGQNLSCGASSSRGKEHLSSSKDVDLKPENCIQDLESSQLTEAVQELAGNSEREPCGFDLNEEVCSEEMASPSTLSSVPITVATTKAAASGIPVVPLHFEGNLGWKGSAVNSAFRPPAPRRTPDGEKTLSVEGSNHSSKCRQEILEIDLNVAGADDDGVTDPALAKQIPESSSLPSGESSVEVSSRRAGRLMLDLNRSGDNEDAPLSDSRTEGQFLYQHRNGHRSPSPASSSSSRQPPVRNIDLNDSPSFFDDAFGQQHRLGILPSQDMNAHGGFQVDDHFISIMGKKVEVNRKDCAPQTRSFLPNGLVGESMEAGMARSGGGVVAPSAMTQTALPSRLFGYGGLTAGPSTAVSPAVYGPSNVPYMGDSRGAPVLLPIMGSPTADPPSYSQSSFFPTNVMGMQSGLNGIGPLQSGFDLNSGVMTVENSVNREAGGRRQLFVQGQGGSLEEQMRSASLPLTSVVGVRRREPDGGWEPYPVAYKRQAPWN